MNLETKLEMFNDHKYQLYLYRLLVSSHLSHSKKFVLAVK